MIRHSQRGRFPITLVALGVGDLQVRALAFTVLAIPAVAFPAHDPGLAVVVVVVYPGRWLGGSEQILVRMVRGTMLFTNWLGNNRCDGSGSKNECNRKFDLNHVE